MYHRRYAHPGVGPSGTPPSPRPLPSVHIAARAPETHVGGRAGPAWRGAGGGRGGALAALLPRLLAGPWAPITCTAQERGVVKHDRNKVGLAGVGATG